jgi:hypothetical protein
MRGQHDGAFEIAHAFARDGVDFHTGDAAVEESYDLVVVGGGISGLAAAWYYRRAVPAARILVLDNCNDFGGHAKRNEFTHDHRLIVGYGGSQSLQSPKTLYSDTAKGLLRDLGVDIRRFETAFDRGLYPSLGLSRAVFFDREAFGRDALVRGDTLALPEGDSVRARGAGRPPDDFVAALPISDAGKAQFLALFDGTRDPLAGRSVKEKLEVLKATSYRDYLIRDCGCSDEVANCFQGRTLDFFGLGCDAVAAADVRDFGYPGFAGSACRSSIIRNGASPISITSPTATPRWRGCWCVRCCPPSHPATPWTTSSSPSSTTMRSIAPARRRASGSTRPASMSATAVTMFSSAMCATAPRIGSRQSTSCSPASTRSFRTSCPRCRKGSARRWPRT